MRATLLGLALCACMAANAADSRSGRAAWFWRTSCGDKGLSVDVTLANKLAYHTVVAICHKARSQAPTPRQDDGFTFPLTPTQPIIFSDSRGTNDFVPAGRSLQMSLWQAGADPDVLTLGVSVADAKEIYVNTLYFAKPDAEMSEEIGTGLVITTKPVRYKP
jgi:hypothetical protein